MAQAYENGKSINAAPSFPVDMARYVHRTYVGAGRGWVSLEMSEKDEPTEGQAARDKQTQVPTLSSQIGWDNFVSGIEDPSLRPTLLAVDGESIIIDDHLAGVIDDYGWGRDPELEHIAEQLEDTSPEEKELEHDIEPHDSEDGSRA